MLIAFDKHYALPSQHHFTRIVLPYMYRQCWEEVTKEVSKVDDFAATTDLWSSHTTEPYISLTIHFIDTEFNLKVKCFQTAFMPEDHTGQNITHGLREALAEWGLNEGKLVCITTDNPSGYSNSAWTLPQDSVQLDGDLGRPWSTGSWSSKRPLPMTFPMTRNSDISSHPDRTLMYWKQWKSH